MLLCVQFVTNWFKIVLGERESEGVDFWWLDWGQGRVCKIAFNISIGLGSHFGFIVILQVKIGLKFRL